MIKPEDIEISMMSNDHKKYVCGKLGNKIYTQRVPLQDWAKCLAEDEKTVFIYTMKLIHKIQKDLYGDSRIREKVPPAA